MRSSARLFFFLASLLLIVAAAPLSAETKLNEPAVTFFADYCFDCHSGTHAEAHINLEQLTTKGWLADSFKQWQRIASMIDLRRMPPEDAAQPSEDEREKIAGALKAQLTNVAEQHAGDPGQVVMRRLTSAEYRYTVADLTGLDLDVGAEFVSDAVGGAGFTNVGGVQFVQEATLERYLEAAKRVADHAVIGAGPLQFFRDPGMTGRELSAINRIQAIYRQHGFRHASGEGGKPFGLEKYAKAFYVAWQYQHRTQLSSEATTLTELAHSAKLDARFAHHIWSVLTDPRPSFPISEIVARWQGLPTPDSAEVDEQAIRRECDEIYEYLHKWQKQLSRAAKHPEEAAKLTGDVTDLAKQAAADIDTETLHDGVLEFAQRLPQVSHYEPAPSDRDPIPQPFDNSYNKPERNFFHTGVKYYRNDRFFVANMIDDQTRERLEQAWIDLLTSFEYHDIFLRFVAEKFEIDLAGRSVANLDEQWINDLAREPRQHVRRLHNEYHRAQASLAAAQPGHVDDVVSLATRAWRRPLNSSDQQRLRDFYQQGRTELRLSHEDAIRTLLVRVLVAPEFIYRAERTTGNQIVPLSDWELANRLSYFLWSSLPDRELRRAAAAGELSDPEQLAHHADRMLHDQKARRFAAEFFGQWLGFYQFDRYTGVDPKCFPEFTESLRMAMHEEAVSLFDYIVRNDRPSTEMLFADYTFVNADLAKHYGMPVDGLTNNKIQPIQRVDRFHRGGLLSLGAILTVTSAPLRTSPVKRGDWILRRILGTPVPPPPADAGSIAADDESIDGLTIREQLEAHRNDAKCANCHSRIDPLGFALEHYDAIGRWRDRYRDGGQIDTSGTLMDGTEIADINGLQDHLTRNQKQFHRTLSQKLLGYALGRRDGVGDALLLDEMVKSLETDGRFSGIVKSVVTSKQFGTKR